MEQSDDGKAGKTPENLEERVGELERIADSLGDVPDDELVETLDKAVELLGEINAGIESGLDDAASETRELGSLLGGVSFGPFDETLEELEKRERGDDGPGS
jgi:hypothetical protein